MGQYPKEVTVSHANPSLWYTGAVIIQVTAIVPEREAQAILNQIGEIL